MNGLEESLESFPPQTCSGLGRPSALLHHLFGFWTYANEEECFRHCSILSWVDIGGNVAPTRVGGKKSSLEISFLKSFLVILKTKRKCRVLGASIVTLRRQSLARLLAPSNQRHAFRFWTHFAVEHSHISIETHPT